MPESYALVERLRADRHAAVISGAGPSVLVLAVGAVDEQAALEHTPAGWTAHPIPVAAGGAEQIS
jgi:homoserine kinase